MLLGCRIRDKVGRQCHRLHAGRHENTRGHRISLQAISNAVLPAMARAVTASSCSYSTQSPGQKLRRGGWRHSSLPTNQAVFFVDVVSRSSSSGSSGGGGGSATHAFDRAVKTMQRDNAARAHRSWHGTEKTYGDGGVEIVGYDYMREEIAARLVDRLDDIKRDEGFPLALDIGSGPGYVHRAICAEEALPGDDDDEEDGDTNRGGIGGVRKLVQLDSSSLMLHRDDDIPMEGGDLCDSYRLVADEESRLPFPDGTFDLVISSASMHWINDLPGLFSEANRVLKPDGCFMFAMVGGTTLAELRVSMVMAELEREGGVSPHVGPFVGLSDVGGLLQRAGFALPTLDIDTIKVAFPSAAVLMEHLQRMGEQNACIKRRERVSRDTFLAASCIYDELYGTTDVSEPHGEIEASVQVIYAIGWTPHESQQKPLKRGTATHKVGEVIVDRS